MALVTEPELMEATGFKSRGRLERVLRDQRVRYFRGKGGIIWTTEKALDHALNLSEDDTPDTELEFED